MKIIKLTTTNDYKYNYLYYLKIGKYPDILYNNIYNIYSVNLLHSSKFTLYISGFYNIKDRIIMDIK